MSLFRFIVLLTSCLLWALMLGEVRADEPVKIVLWHGYRGDERAALEEAQRRFNESQVGVQLSILAVPFEVLADKISASVPRGAGPDIFIFPHDRIGVWAEQGIIEPIEFLVTDDIAAQFIEPCLSAATYRDSIYGLPITVQCVALFYNKRLVERPPSETAEMISMGRRAMSSREGAFGLVYENTNFYYHACWLFGFGGQVLDEEGNPKLTSEGCVRSFAFAGMLAKEAGIMPEEISGTLVTSLFNEGRAAMVISGPWLVAELSEEVDFGVAPLPVIEETRMRAKPFATVSVVMMSAQSQRQEQAFEVMRFLTGPDVGRIFLETGKQVSANMAAYEGGEGIDEVTLAFREQVASAVPMPNNPEMSMVWSPATSALTSVIREAADPGQALQKAQAEVEKAILEYRE